jgi:hypothetical protein
MILLSIPGVLSGQSARQAPGAWVAAGAVVGSSRLYCDACGSATESRAGVAPEATFGYTLGPSLALALDLTGTVNAHDGVRDRYGYFTMGAVFFPVASTPFSIEAGAGVARYREDIPRSASSSTRDYVGTSGFGWRVGAGYEIALTPSLALLPRVQYLNGGSTSLRLGRVASGYSASHQTIAGSIQVVWNFTANPFALRRTR